MSDTEEEWTTVRRRRGRSGIPKQLKALAIPVIPAAFDALAEPEERPTQDATKAKKKKKGKKAKAPGADDDGEEEDPMAGGKPEAVKTAAKAGAAKASAAGGSGQATARQSLFAWLLSRLVAVLVMLGLMRASISKRKRKSKAAAGHKTAATDETKAPTAVPALAAKPTTAAATTATSESVGPVTPVAAAAKALEQVPKQPTQQMAPAKAAAAVTPVKRQAEPTPVASLAKGVATAAASKPAAAVATAAAAATPLVTAAAPATPTPASAKPDAVSTPAADIKPKPSEPPPAPATPSAPPPPAIKYDPDWGRGKFVMQSLPTAHADVVAAVALAGDVAVSAGYDGAVKLWHWPAPGTAGGGVAPRLAVSRVLVGHNGRVEALAAHAESRRLATCGRDSTLKVWDLGSEPGGSGASELASTYVYESVRSLAADWDGEGGAAAGRVLLGARSGTVLVYSLGAGGAGRKVAALRGHTDEVTALKFLNGGGSSGKLAVSGARDGTVRLWDLRTSGGAAAAVLKGLCGRVCSLSCLGEHHISAGDCSSTVKLWDLRQLLSSPATRGSAASPPLPQRLPNAPGFAGSSCPTAGLWHGPRSGVLLSSCIAWWTANKQALEEAPSTAKIPMACLNVSAVGPPAVVTTDPDGRSLLAQYQYTLRLGLGVVTCLAGDADEGAVLTGGASGALWALRLVRGGSAAAAAAERAAASAAESMAASGAGNGSCEVVDALVVGAEEFSDDEYDDEEDEDEDE